MDIAQEQTTMQPAPWWGLARTLAVMLSLACMMTTALGQNEGTIRPNFNDVELITLIDAVSQATGRNIIVDPRVVNSNAKVTLKSTSDMTTAEFWETFLAVLQVHDFAAVQSGPVWKIIPAAVSRQQPGETERARIPPDEMTTQVIEVKNVQASPLIGALRPLVAQYGHMQVIQGTNMIVIVDRAANVTRIAEIIRKIDRSSDQEIEHIQLEHATAGELVRVLSALSQAAAASQAAAGAAGGVTNAMVADDRTNAILLSGDPSFRFQMRLLIAKLDTPLEGGGNTRVRYLRYADAETLATSLQTMAAETQQQQQGAAAPRGDMEDTNIWADPQNNALVVTAPPKQMGEIMRIVDQLDIRRAQVLVRAIIADITDDSSAELGITWAVQDDDLPVGLTNFSDGIGVAQVGGALINGSTDGTGPDLSQGINLIPDGVTFAVGRIREDSTSYALILRALQGDANTNILGTPEIMTLDNEEAEISVGQEVPFVTGQFTNTGAAAGAVNPFQTIQREDVGTRLKITPQINEGNAVIMDIEIEVSSVAGVSAIASDVVTNKRTINNTIIIEDGGMIVLGGLIQDELVEQENRVPGLGRIPVLGNLFRSRDTSLIKRNLMVFLQVSIVRDAAQATIETNQKYNYMRDLQVTQDPNPQLMPKKGRPVLVPIDEVGEAVNVMQPRNEETEKEGTESEDGGED